MSKQNLENLTETVKRLLRRKAENNLKNLLHKVHASDAARVIERFSKDNQDYFISLLSDSENLPHIFSELGSSFLDDYLNRHENYDFLTQIFQQLPSDEMVDLIEELEPEKSDELLKRMKSDRSKVISDLLQYQEETAGALMSSEVLKIPQDYTVKQTIEVLQNSDRAVTVFYLYVVDEFDNLCGVLSVRQLFQFDHETKLKDMMLRDVVRVHVDEPQEEVARIVSQYDLVAIPVVDLQNKLVGVITVDDVIDVIFEEAAENVLKLGNAEVDAIEDYSFWSSLKSRVPWIVLLSLAGIISFEVIFHFVGSRYSESLGLVVGLLPLLFRIPSNISRRISSIVLQAYESENKNPQIIKKIFGQQSILTIVLSLLASFLLMLYLQVRFGMNLSTSYPLVLSLFIAMMISLLLGILVPLLVYKIHKDLAWRMGSFINTIVDIFAIIIYFNLTQ